jgi:hypothetical protein
MKPVSSIGREVLLVWQRYETDHDWDKFLVDCNYWVCRCGVKLKLYVAPGRTMALIDAEPSTKPSLEVVEHDTLAGYEATLRYFDWLGWHGVL